MHTRSILSAAAAALVGTAASAQNETLVLTGDSLPGLGVVDDIYDVAVNDAGDWVVSLHASLMAANETAVLKNGVVVLKPGDVLPGYVPGFTFTSARALDIDAAGSWSWTAASPTSSSFGTGAYLDTTLYAAIGTPVNVPGVTPGTTYTGLYDQVLGSGGTLVVHGIMFDPAILGIQQNFLMSLVPQAGGSFSSTMIVKRGDFLPGSDSPVQSLSEWRQGIATNASGQLIYLPTFLDSIEAVYLDQVPLAVEGQQSPVFGRLWGSFNRMPVALNDAGDHAYGGRLQGDFNSDQILVWNGVELAQEGDSLPSIAPYSLRDLGLGKSLPNPIQLSDDGELLWYGAWDDPDTTRDSGLFLDQALLLQEGVSAVGGLVIDDFNTSFGVAPVYDSSPDGETIAISVLLQDGRTGAFLIRPTGAVDTIQGCVPNLGTMTASVPMQLGSGSAVTLDGAQSLGANAFVFLSTAGLGPCGLTLPGVGEVLIDVTPPNPILMVPSFFPGQPQAVAFLPAIPADPLLFGFTLHVQGVWVDTTGAVGVPLFRLTNALVFTIGL